MKSKFRMLLATISIMVCASTYAATIFCPTGIRMFCALFGLYPGASAETARTELHIMTNCQFDIMNRYANENQVSVITEEYPGDIMEEIANGFVTKNEDVDIYIFDAQNGLYDLKDKGFYYPLNSSAQLMAAYSNLYPAFRNALMSNGDFVAWIMFAQPFVRMESSDVLTANGIKSPTTFSDFLDACRDLLATDALGSDYSLMDIVSYTQRDMLDFYMKLYIMSSQAQLGKVNFSDNHFSQTVARIKKELPATEPIDMNSEQETLPTPIFCLMAGYETITSSMLPMPTVLDNAPTAIETYMTVAVINPASPRKEQAIRFLEYCSKHKDIYTYFYDASCCNPAENPTVVEQINSATEKINALVSLAEPLTPEQRNDLALQQRCLSDLEKNRYMVTPDAIKHYAKMANSIYISEESPIAYDDALQGTVARYLNGIIDLQKFVENCQRHVDLIEHENVTR